MYKKVVVMGGGTGISYLLRGLKDFPVDITAVITVSDNGRSTGKLREEFHTPAVGDIRKVITNLSQIDEPIKKMMSYRFKTSSDLDGHAVGNLILTAMLDITGSLKDSIAHLSKILDVRHTVLPISEDSNLTLMGKDKDGYIVEGEEQITKAHRQFEKIFYKKEPKVLPEVLKAIKEADLIIFSMGSLYTSVLPNIICKEVKETLNQAKAPIMYLSNIVTQPGETDDHNVLDHVNAIVKHTNKNIIDYVISNNEVLPKEMIDRYQKDGATQVLLDENQKKLLKIMGAKTIEENLIEIKSNYIRHDAIHISDIVINLALSHCNDKNK